MQKQATIQVMGGAWRSPTGIELLKPGSTQMRPSCPAMETPEALTCPLPTFMVAVSCDSELGGFTSDIQEHSKIPRPGSNGATNLQSHCEAHMSSWLHESESQKIPPVGATMPEISKLARVQNSKTSVRSARTTAPRAATDSLKFLAFNQWSLQRLL